MLAENLAAPQFTLDTAFQQCLVNVVGAAAQEWQHRVLLVRGPGQQWIWLSPDGDVSAADLGTCRIRPLRRNSPFPPALAGNLLIFDPVSDADLNAYYLDARELASIMGFELPAELPNAAKWFVSDPVSASYGEEIPPSVYMDDQVLIGKGGVGIVDIDGTWTQCVRLVGPTPWEAYLKLIADGPRLDCRLSGDQRDTEGRRFMTFPDALLKIKPINHVGWPLPGDRSVKEVLTSMRDSGQAGWDDHHTCWTTKSGVGGKSSVCREHGIICVVLRLFMQFDQLDISNLAGCEYLVRRLLQIEAAVKRNPRQPDFEGLDAILDSSVDTSGAALAPKFMEFVANIQKSQALVYKAGRLWHEEQTQMNKKTNNANPKGGGKGDS